MNPRIREAALDHTMRTRFPQAILHLPFHIRTPTSQTTPVMCGRCVLLSPFQRMSRRIC